MIPLGYKRHIPFYIALLCGLAAMPLALWLSPELTIEAAANVFFLVYLALSAVKIRRLTVAFLKKHAARADEPVWVIFVVTIGAAMVAVVSLFVVINGSGDPDVWALGLSLASVALGWLTVHTMFALHFAHRYWEPAAKADSPMETHKPSGGLEFPGTEEPQGYDFLYFGFVIGMTAQTSDVQITTTRMRRLALLHGVVSFLFNTVLVAAAVNVAVSLAS
jgi:uncharacterized membrane protein